MKTVVDVKRVNRNKTMILIIMASLFLMACTCFGGTKLLPASNLPLPVIYSDIASRESLTLKDNGTVIQVAMSSRYSGSGYTNPSGLLTENQQSGHNGQVVHWGNGDIIAEQASYPAIGPEGQWAFVQHTVPQNQWGNEAGTFDYNDVLVQSDGRTWQAYSIRDLQYTETGDLIFSAMESYQTFTLHDIYLWKKDEDRPQRLFDSLEDNEGEQFQPTRYGDLTVFVNVYYEGRKANKPNWYLLQVQDGQPITYTVQADGEAVGRAEDPQLWEDQLIFSWGCGGDTRAGCKPSVVVMDLLSGNIMLVAQQAKDPAWWHADWNELFEQAYQDYLDGLIKKDPNCPSGKEVPHTAEFYFLFEETFVGSEMTIGDYYAEAEMNLGRVSLTGYGLKGYCQTDLYEVVDEETNYLWVTYDMSPPAGYVEPTATPTPTPTPNFSAPPYYPPSSGGSSEMESDLDSLVGLPWVDWGYTKAGGQFIIWQWGKDQTPQVEPFGLNSSGFMIEGTRRLFPSLNISLEEAAAERAKDHGQDPSRNWLGYDITRNFVDKLGGTIIFDQGGYENGRGYTLATVRGMAFSPDYVYLLSLNKTEGGVFQHFHTPILVSDGTVNWVYEATTFNPQGRDGVQKITLDDFITKYENHPTCNDIRIFIVRIPRGN